MLVASISYKHFRTYFQLWIVATVLLHQYSGKDIIGLAETGSGKTGAFALPILQALLETPQKLFALVLTPTRELAYQISEQFEALGTTIGIKCGKFWSCHVGTFLILLFSVVRSVYQRSSLVGWTWYRKLWLLPKSHM